MAICSPLCISATMVVTPVPRIYSSCLKSLTILTPKITLPGTMEPLILPLLLLTFALNRHLAIENLALRQQLAILRRQIKRPTLRNRDRLFWVIMSRAWKNWRKVLIVVKPETVIGWNRMGFRLFWKMRSRKRRVGRPPLDPRTRRMILDMARANPTWGAPRIHGELKSLGIEVHEKTVSNIMRRFRSGRPSSQTWGAFLRNHTHNTCAIDFLTVPDCDLQNPLCLRHSPPWVQEGGAFQRNCGAVIPVGRTTDRRSVSVGYSIQVPATGS